MDQIKEALSKAKASQGNQPPREHRDSPGAVINSRSAPTENARPAWNPAEVRLDSRHLAKHRIAWHSMNDPAYIAFNQLRTRVLKALKDNRWKSVAITSPSAGCGKTTVAVNLAISIARIPQCRTALVDLDLHRPSVARVLGVRSPGSIGDYYQGASELQECFVHVGDSLFVGLGNGHFENASELIQGPRTADLFRDLCASVDPNVILFDLPPLLASDDAIGFIPNVDAVLIVVAAGTNTAAEVHECERQVAGIGKFAAIVLNKVESRLSNYKYYYEPAPREIR